MMRMRPIPADAERAIDSYDLLCAGLLASQAATPTAHAAGEAARRRTRAAALADAQGADLPDWEGKARRRCRFHSLDGLEDERR